jgi:hypothetical protein
MGDNYKNGSPIDLFLFIPDTEGGHLIYCACHLVMGLATSQKSPGYDHFRTGNMNTQLHATCIAQKTSNYCAVTEIQIVLMPTTDL